MICAWHEFLKVLPRWLAQEVDQPENEALDELRLRLGAPPELKFGKEWKFLCRNVVMEDLVFVVNTASRYSPWAASSMGQGYLTVTGGHRIGVCGEVVMKNGKPEGIRKVTGLCLRVCRDFPGIGANIGKLHGSILLLGPPGSGKTTLLRDALRCISEKETVCAVDERGEIFPEQFVRGQRIDVLTGCPKAEGIDMVLRTMGPSVIGVDEITSENDCDALIRAGWCGVRIFATAHAATADDLRCRPVYQKLYSCHLFDHILVLGRDKRWREERVDI